MLNQSDIIYFVVTDRFSDGGHDNNALVDKTGDKMYHGGDFAGIIEKIPYLKHLGITALWITPVYLNIGALHPDTHSYHGYWAMSFEKVDPHLYSQHPGLAEGSKAYLRELSDKLHLAGIKLILDMVVNHTGYHTEHYMANHDPVIRDHWYNRHKHGEKESELAGLPDLDHDNPDVADYFVNNIVDWIEAAGIDAIRMDTVKHVEDAFWHHFKSYVKGKHPQVTLVGEVLHYDVKVISSYQKDHDFDTLFDFPLCAALKATLVHNAGMNRIAKPRLHEDEVRGALDMDKYYTNANRLVTLLDNHDLDKRFMTEILDRWGHWDRFRATRIFKLAITFLLTTRGIPQLYYGTEIGMEGWKDPDNRRDFPWDIFGSGLMPLEEHDQQREIYRHTLHMIRIRKTNPALRQGYLFTLYVDHFVYAVMREFQGNTMITVFNNGLEAMPHPLPIPIGINGNIPTRIKDNLENRPLENLLKPGDTATVAGGVLPVQLEGKEAAVYRLM